MKIASSLLMALIMTLAVWHGVNSGSDPNLDEITSRLLTGRYYLVGISDGYINQYTSRIRFFRDGNRLAADAQSGVPESYALGVTDLALQYPNLNFTMIARDPQGGLMAVRDCRAVISDTTSRIPYTCFFMIGPDQARAAPQQGELVRDTGQAIVMFKDVPADGCFLSSLRQ